MFKLFSPVNLWYFDWDKDREREVFSCSIELLMYSTSIICQDLFNILLREISLIRTLSSYSLWKTFWVPDGNQTRNLIAGEMPSHRRSEGYVFDSRQGLRKFFWENCLRACVLRTYNYQATTITSREISSEMRRPILSKLESRKNRFFNTLVSLFWLATPLIFS